MDGKNYINRLKERPIIAVIVTVVVLGALPTVIQDTYGHGVMSQLQSRFVTIEDESFSTQTLHTGEEVEVGGKLISKVNRDLRAWISLFSESENAGNRWEFVSRDPPGNVFDIQPGAEVPYRLRVKALEPGVYHMHTQLNIANVGPGLGDGQTVVVEGSAIVKPYSMGNVIYQTILIAVGLGVSFATRPWQVI